MTQSVKHVIVDIETSGLDPDKHTILELGILLLDYDLNEVASYSAIVSDHLAIAHLDWLETTARAAEAHPRGSAEYQQVFKGAVLCHEMHQRSGLAAEIRAAHAAGPGKSLSDIEVEASEFLAHHHLGPHHPLPMTGSSVHFDRGFLATHAPDLNAMFHYRNVDISSFKGVLNIYRADLVDLREQTLAPQGLHRALPDCRDTAEEYRFYLRNVFSVAALPRVAS